MPIFEYVCQECDHEFEALVYGVQKATCPKCQSQKLAPQVSLFAVAAKGFCAAARRPPDAVPAAIRGARAPARWRISTESLGPLI